MSCAVAFGLRLNQGKLEDSLYEALLDPYCGLFMAQTAEKCAAKYGISREAQDQFALRSQQAASAAWAAGRFADEVVPVEIKARKGVTTVDRDDHLRPDTTLEGLAKLPAAFSKEGSVTAGNASGIVDGGAALLLASGEAVADRGLKPLARLVAWAAVGVDPSYMGMGPAPATRKALRTRRTLAGSDRFDRGQRGVRRAVPRGRTGARTRSGKDERQRRRDCPWPSARHDRNAPAADAHTGTRPPRQDGTASPPRASAEDKGLLR